MTQHNINYYFFAKVFIIATLVLRVSQEASALVEGDLHSPFLLNGISYTQKEGIRFEVSEIKFVGTQPTIDVSIDKNAPVRFFIDTASSRTFLFSDSAKKLNLRPREFRGSVKTANDLDLELLDVDEISIKGTRFTLHGLWRDNGIFAPISEAEEIFGVIGWDLLRNLSFSLNLSKKTFVINLPKGQQSDAEIDPVWAILPIFEGSPNAPDPLRFLIDSGGRFDYMITSSNQARSFGIEDPPDSIAIAIAGDERSLGKCIAYQDAAPKFTVETTGFPKGSVIAGAEHPVLAMLGVDVLLGIGFLLQNEVLFEPSSSQISFLPSRVVESVDFFDPERLDSYSDYTLYFSNTYLSEFLGTGRYPSSDTLPMIASWIGETHMVSWSKFSQFDDQMLREAGLLAATFGNSDVLRIADLQVANRVEFRENVWRSASIGGRIDILRWLSSSQTPVPMTAPNERDLLSLAADSGSLEAVRYLLPLSHRAISFDDLVRFSARSKTDDFLRLMALASNVESALSPALYVSCRHANWDLALELLTMGASPKWVSRMSGRSALHEAAARNNLVVVERLLSAGADPLLTDKDKRHVITDAIASGAGEILVDKLLMATGNAPLTIEDTLSILTSIAKFGNKDYAEAAERRNIVPTQLPDQLRFRLLLLVCSRGSLDLTKWFFGSELDYVQIDQEGHTLLKVSLLHRHKRLSLWVSEQNEVRLSDSTIIDAAGIALAVGFPRQFNILVSNLRPGREFDPWPFWKAAYESGEVECLEAVNLWCIERQLTIPTQRLKVLSLEHPYNSVADWIASVQE